MFASMSRLKRHSLLSFAQIFFNILFIHVTLATLPYHGPYTSCQTSTTTSWTKGSGPPIRSWLRSIVPLLPDSPTDIYTTPTGLVATFTRSYLKEYVKEISSSVLNITWRIHGKGKFDGWFYGPTVDDGQFSGDNIAYIYQDLTTVILGTFQNGVLVAGKEARIKAYRCSNGLMELKFSKPRKDSPVFKFERMTERFISSDLLAMDPHDRRHVFVTNSTLKNLTNGDGLFAKRYIPAHSLVAIYAGYFIHVNESIFYDNMTSAEREEAHKNLMSYNDTHNLNLPPELTSILSYRATLGHKVNNALRDARNTEFCFITHPRFGHCRCIRSFKAIAKGEEIFIDYGYDVNEESAPQWYKQLYAQTYEEKGNSDDPVDENEEDMYDGGRD